LLSWIARPVTMIDGSWADGVVAGAAEASKPDIKAATSINAPWLPVN
jgi:hypothetical protein